MSDSEFEVGDTVRLRSGGPDMTITEVAGNEIYVVWFTEKGENKHAMFPPEALEEA